MEGRGTVNVSMWHSTKKVCHEGYEMKNVLELSVMPDTRVKTTITTTDSVTTMEIHKSSEKDQDVLLKMGRNKFYRSFKGSWVVSLPQDFKTFEGQEFTDATAKALTFINERDNPDIYIINFF